MRTTASVVVASMIFLFSWALLAGLMYLLIWTAVKAGQGVGIFMLLNVLAIWVLGPLFGAGVAVYATNRVFPSVPLEHIHIGFVSVCAALILVLVVLSVPMLVSRESSIWEFLSFIMQAGAIFLGANIGKKFSQPAGTVMAEKIDSPE